MPTLAAQLRCPTWRDLLIVSCSALNKPSDFPEMEKPAKTVILGQQLFLSISSDQKPLSNRVSARLFITIGKEKAEEGEQLCSFSFPFHRLIWEKRSGRGLRAGRAFVFYVTGC